ncbi:restriction endonuclease subunit S [Psychrobacter sp.]|uniref:restriction endonuclease subunit S n=1 Tax=Psychrobacter sp. TaxID=56811 RepID=UPI002FD94AE1
MSDWVNTSLGKLGKFSTSSVDKKVLLNQKIVRLVNYMDVYNSNSIDSTIDFMYVSASEVERTRSQVKVGDILFTPSSETPDDIGYSAVVCEDLENTLHSYHTVRYRPHNDQTFDIRFSAWFCNSVNIRKQFEQKCAGSTRYTLSIPSFTSVQISIPESKKEQGKIAKYLDMIQQTIEKTEALIAKYQLIKAGLMQDLFTRGIGSDGKLRPTREQAPELYQETQIGWIPKDWDLSHLKSMSKDSVQHLRTGPFGSALKGEHWREEGHPVITIGSLGEGEFNESELLYIGNKDVNRLIDFKLKLDDVVFSRVADVGRSSVIKDEQVGWIMSSNLMRISLDSKKMIADFLQYQLSSNDLIRRQIRCKVNAGGRDVANSEVLNSLWFIQPDYDEQLAIVKRAEKIEAKLKTERYLVRKLEQQKQGLMHDLLTGKKRVTVDESEAEHV